MIVRLNSSTPSLALKWTRELELDEREGADGSRRWEIVDGGKGGSQLAHAVIIECG